MNSLVITRPKQRAIVLSYIIAFLVCVPYWWYITTVPRAPLPHNDIARLKSATTLPIVFEFDWDPICKDANNNGWTVASFASAINVVTLNTETNTQFDAIFNSRRIHLASNSDWSLSFRVIVKSSHTVSSTTAPFNNVCVITPTRPDRSPGTVIVADNGTIGVIASKPSEVGPALAAYVSHLAKLLTHPLKSMHFSKSYEVLLSLMVQNPAATPIRTWSAAQVAQSHLRPLLINLLGDTSRFKLVSQIQYLTVPGEGVDLPPSSSEGVINNRLLIDPDTGKWLEQPSKELHFPPPVPLYIPSDQLPLFINPDWNLASVTPNHTTVHLVTFVPDPSTPMTILDESGNEVKSNSFLSPRWGGVNIHNSPQGANHLNQTSSLQFARVWTKHLRKLFGVIPLQEPVMVADHRIIFMPSRKGISTTEVAIYHLSQYVIHITKVSEILQALIRLTDSLDNLPISPKISNLVHQALTTVHAALGIVNVKEEMRVSSVSDKFQAAWEARVGAELAFFDSDMVGLAYFPSEHTYAVYMPLFVPVLVTMMVVVFTEFRLWRTGK